MKKKNKDVGYIEDLLTALINLTHAEWHSIKSFFETNDADWIKISAECRKDRGELLDKITKENDGELWCYNKHSLLFIGAFIELGNRDWSKGNKEEAIKNYEKAKKWLGIFLIKNNIGGTK